MRFLSSGRRQNEQSEILSMTGIKFFIWLSCMGFCVCASGAQETFLDRIEGLLFRDGEKMFRIGPTASLSKNDLVNDPVKGTDDSGATLSSGLKEESGFSEEVLNRIHDVTKAIITISGIGVQLKTNIESLKEELDREVMSHNLQISQVFTLLRERISGKPTNSYMREAEIWMMGGLLKEYTPSPQEALETVDILRKKIKASLYVRRAAMHVIKELMEHSVVLNQESLDSEQFDKVVRQVLYLLERNLFKNPMSVRKIAKEAMIVLFSLGTIPELEKKKSFFRISERTNEVKWQRRLTALQCLHWILSQGFLLDLEEGDQMARQLMGWLNNENWPLRKEAMRVLYKLLQNDLLSDPLELEVSLKAAELIFDIEEGGVGVVASLLVKSFLRGDAPLPGKEEVANLVVKNLPYASNGKRKALTVLRVAAQNNVPLSLDAFEVAVDLVSEPSSLGTKAENFIKDSLPDSNLPETEKMEIILDTERQSSNRDVLEQLGPQGREALREFLRDTNISNGDSLEIEINEPLLSMEEQVSSGDSLLEPSPERAVACHRAMQTVLVIETF